MDKLLEETVEAIQAGMPGAHISSDDYSRIDAFIRRLADRLGFTPLEWNFGYGRVRFDTKDIRDAEGGGLAGTDGITRSPADALEMMYDPNENRKLLVIKNARLALDGEQNRGNLARLQQTLFRIKKNREDSNLSILGEPYGAAIVYVDETRFIPPELASLVYYAELPPPPGEELEKMVNSFADTHPELAISAETKHWLSARCVGMNEDVFLRILARAAAKPDFESEVKKIANAEKKQSVEKSGLLKFVAADVNLKRDVGGLKNLRSWLDQKQAAIKNPDAAREAGIKPAKGVLLVGMPGCGKTLTAKSIADLLGFPLLSLDMGSLMGKYVGQSEEQMRRALNLAEYSSPCVLWIDEIEKAFAGTGGDETGVSQRLFGYMLTWLQEHEKTVFVVATANDVTVLPPEFLRRGRFDEIFYIDFPKLEDRARIFEIHINKKTRLRDEETDSKKLVREEINCKELARHPNVGFDDSLIYNEENKPESGLKYPPASGSDIEAVVNTAAEIAWQDQNHKTLSQGLIEKQLKYLKPLAKVLEDKIKKTKEKFGQYDLRLAGFDPKDLRMFEEGADSSDPEKRKEIACDEGCPLNILEKLANHVTESDAGVRRAVLENPAIGEKIDILAMLAKDPDPGISSAATEKFSKSNEGILRIMQSGTAEEKIKLLKAFKEKEIAEEAQLAAAKDKNVEVRIALAHCKYLSMPVMEKLGRDSFAGISEIILKREYCPESLKFKKVCGNCREFRTPKCNSNRSGSYRQSGCDKFVGERKCYACKHYNGSNYCKHHREQLGEIASSACSEWAAKGSTGSAQTSGYICMDCIYLNFSGSAYSCNCGPFSNVHKAACKEFIRK